MSIRAPHFLLMSETTTEADQNQWRFVLASSDGDQKLVASDTEPATQGERLELLSVVRGLEALEQPSEVTLLTDSRYVSQGIAHGLSEWRSNDWCWERFGELTPVKNLDLWQRVDRALKFHHVDCRTWRFDSAHTAAEEQTSPASAPQTEQEPLRSSEDHPAKVRWAASRRSGKPQPSRPMRAAFSAQNPQPTREKQPARRPGMFAVCRAWLQQTAETVRGLQTKVSFETQ